MTEGRVGSGNTWREGWKGDSGVGRCRLCPSRKSGRRRKEREKEKMNSTGIKKRTRLSNKE